MRLGEGDIDGAGLALLAEVLVGDGGLGHAKASTVLPDETAIALDGEAVVIVAAADAADDAGFFVYRALIIVVLGGTIVIYIRCILGGVVGGLRWETNEASIHARLEGRWLWLQCRRRSRGRSKCGSGAGGCC